MLPNSSAYKSNNLITFFINIQCIRNKLLGLEDYLQTAKVDIFLVCEHWLQEEEKHLYNFSNFTLISIYCRKKGIHGGVGIYLKNNIQGEEICL